MASNEWEDVPIKKQDEWEDVPARPRGEFSSDLDRLGFDLRSVAEGYTLGASEPVVSGVKAGIGTLTSDKPFKELYEADIAERKAEKAAYPAADLAMQLTGGVLPGPGLAAKVGKGAIAGAEALGKGLTAAAPLLSKAPNWLKFLGKTSAAGAIGSGGAEVVRQASQVPTGFTEFDPGRVVDVAQSGAVAAPAIGGAINTVRALPSAGSKIVQNITGANKQAVEDYLKKGKVISGVEPSKIKDSIDEVLNDLQERKVAAKDLIKEKARDFKYSIADKKRDTQFELKNARFAEEQIKDKASVSAAEKIEQAIKTLKEEISQGSTKSFDILKGDDRILELNPKRLNLITKRIDQAVDKLTVQGTPTGDVSASSVANLLNFKNRIRSLIPMPPPAQGAGLSTTINEGAEYTGKIKLSEIKKLLQGLDADTKALYSAPAGSFSQPEMLAKAKIRGLFDRLLKSHSPEYAEQMKSVADDARLMSQVRKAFPGQKSSPNILLNADSEQNKRALDILSQLENRTGQTIQGEFSKAVAPYSQKTQSLQSELSAMTPEASSKQLSEMITQSPEMAQFKNVLAESQPLSGLSPKSSENFIKRVSGRKAPIEDVKKLEALEQKIPGVSDQLDDYRLMREFSGPRTQGSRNVMSFGGAGGLIGGALAGPPGAALGGTLGAGFGREMDIRGPEYAKKLLDYYLTSPNFQKGVKSLQQFGPGQETQLRLIQQSLSRYKTDKEAQDEYINAQ